MKNNNTIKSITSSVSAYTSAKIVKAAKETIALRDRTVHPAGLFDNGGRFYIASRCDCCIGVRSPSRSFPFSEMVHARSAVHVAHTFGVQEHISLVKAVIRLLDKKSKVSMAA